MDWLDFDQVIDDLDGTEDGSPDATGQAHDLAVAVADGTDAMQRALDPGAVVLAERTHVVDHVLDVVDTDLALAEDFLATTAEARLRPAAQVHDDLDDGVHPGQRPHVLTQLGRHGREQRFEVVGRIGRRRGGHGLLRCRCGHQTAGTSEGSATRTRASLISRETDAMASMPCSSRR